MDAGLQRAPERPTLNHRTRATVAAVIVVVVVLAGVLSYLALTAPSAAPHAEGSTHASDGSAGLSRLAVKTSRG